MQSFMKKPKWWNQPNKAKRRTYTLQEPENQVLKYQNPRKKKHKTLWNSTKSWTKHRNGRCRRQRTMGWVMILWTLVLAMTAKMRRVSGSHTEVLVEENFDVVANLEWRVMPTEMKVLDQEWLGQRYTVNYLGPSPTGIFFFLPKDINWSLKLQSWKKKKKGYLAFL